MPFITRGKRWLFHLACGPLSILLLLFHADAAGQTPEFRVETCVQDATGRVWARAYDSKESSPWALSTLDGDDWRRAPIPPEIAGTGAQVWPDALRRQKDGSIVCQWRLQGTDGAPSPPETAFSRHLGADSAVIARVAAKNRSFNGALLDRRGDIWLSEGRIVYRVRSGGRPVPGTGALEQVAALTTDQYYPRPDPPEPDARFCSLALFDDPEGAVWAWTPKSPDAPWEIGLRGLCRLGEKRVEHFATIKGMPEKPLTALEQIEAWKYWVAADSDGLYDLDLKKRTASRLPEPAPNAFRFVCDIKQLGRDQYVFAAAESETERPTGELMALWRHRDGQWTQLAAGLQSGSPASLVETSEGVWTTAAGQGLLFVPAGGGEAVTLDWRRGFPFRRVASLYGLPDGRLLASSDDWGALPALLKTADLLGPHVVAPNIEVIRVLGSLRKDRDGRLWGVPGESPERLSMWDGEQWKSYPIPPNDQAVAFADLMLDSRSRLWVWYRYLAPQLRNDSTKGPVAIFDPAAGAWQNRPSLLNALEAERNTPDFSVGDNIQPIFSKDGRIAFRFWEPYKVFYFNGEKWRGFLWADFGGGQLTDLYFGASGRLTANTMSQKGEGKNETWELDDADGWKQVEYRVRADGPERSRSKEMALWEMFPEPRYLISTRAIIQDALGMPWAWVVEGGRLVKRGPTVSAPQFGPGECHPFMGTMQVFDVLPDPKGNLFVRADWDYRSGYVLVKPRLPLPEAQIDVTSESLDTVKVRMACTKDRKPAPAEEPCWFVWRMDNGTWSPIDTKAEVRFEGLTGGVHRFEAYAFDKWLQPSPTPAVSEIRVNVNPDAQIADWIKALASPNYAARESAVAALIRAGQPTLSALKKARESANDDLKWWIDAALQRIEQKR